MSGAIALAALCLALTGCETLRHGRTPAAGDGEMPQKREILAQLAARDAEIQNFRAAATFEWDMPDVEERTFRGTIAFVRPEKLYLRGNHRISGARLFELRASGDAWELDVARDDQQYSGAEGEPVESVPFRVAPADVAREVFFPVDWENLKPRDVDMSATQNGRGATLLEIDESEDYIRRVEVELPECRVISNSLLTRDGAVVAQVRCGDYDDVGGVPFASSWEASFPRDDARLMFELRNIRINTEDVTPALFAVHR